MDIKDKIAKLLALGSKGKNPNEHERLAALEAANKLMEEHELTEAEVMGSTRKVAVDRMHTSIPSDPWIRQLTSIIAKLYGCQILINGNKIDIIGIPEHAGVSYSMATWMIKAIQAEANKAFKTPRERRSFCLGASNVLTLKGQQMLKAKMTTQTAVTESYALMRQDAIKAYLATLYTSPMRSRGVAVNASAYGLGESFGSGIHLGQQIGATTKRIGAH